MLEVRDVVISYDGFDAVKGVTFSVEDGEFFTLLGPSGCGKTTTLRAISGFERVKEGKILLNGKDIAPLAPEEREIGYVFQNYALFPSMTVFENIAFGLKLRHIKKNEIKAKVEDIARLTGITEHLDKKISQISGGQQQRVAIARALVLNPSLLLMDEPLSNLDAKLRVSMRGEIKRIQKELGIVCIYVTHDQEEAMAISDHIAVFNNGHIEQIGTPFEIYSNPKTEFTARFVGDINEINSSLLNRIGSKTIDGKKCFIRTEKISLNKEVTASGLNGVIKTIEYLGSTTKVGVELDEGSLIHSLAFDYRCNEGERVSVSFNKKDLLFIG